MSYRRGLFLFFVVCGCSIKNSPELHKKEFSGADSHFLVVLVDAKQLDYTSFDRYIRSLSSSAKPGEVPTIGHAWIVLSKKEGASEKYFFEGGHSGEMSETVPSVLDGIWKKAVSSQDKNPIAHLFSMRDDGQKEHGSGGHIPTYAVAFPLSEEGFCRIKRLIEEEYDFSSWSMASHNCIDFTRACLSSIGIFINCEQQIKIPKQATLFGKKIHLYEESRFSCILIKTPELLENRLRSLVEEGCGMPALQWYQNKK